MHFKAYLPKVKRVDLRVLSNAHVIIDTHFTRDHHKNQRSSKTRECYENIQKSNEKVLVQHSKVSHDYQVNILKKYFENNT